MTVMVPEVVPRVPMPGLIAHCGAGVVGREGLLGLPIPDATRTHKPIPHVEVVQVLIETLGLRRDFYEQMLDRAQRAIHAIQERADQRPPRRVDGH